MLMLFGALFVVQLSAEVMDGADEVRVDVRWLNILSFARSIDIPHRWSRRELRWSIIL